MRTTHFFSLLLLSLLALAVSCKKEDNSPTSLGGETNIPLNAVDSTSFITISYGGQSLSGSSLRVKANNDGVITYEGLFDLNTLTPEQKLEAAAKISQLADFYGIDASKLEFTPDQKVKFEFQLKVTSEGYLDYFVEGKPWVMVRYDDGVGKTYSITTSKGETLTRTITEKTGIDEYPFAFFLIKTTKVEQQAPADDPVIESVSYRVNHRFGLVWVEYKMKDGTSLAINIFATWV